LRSRHRTAVIGLPASGSAHFCSAAARRVEMLAVLRSTAIFVSRWWCRRTRAADRGRAASPKRNRAVGACTHRERQPIGRLGVGGCWSVRGTLGVMRSAPREPARPGDAPGSYASVSGEGGIRTLGTLADTHDFQSCTFGHSVTSPRPEPGFIAEAQSSTPEPSVKVTTGPAERVGVEPTVPLRIHLISNQAPSATRSSLRGGLWQRR
jgi:hypothetical protein